MEELERLISNADQNRINCEVDARAYSLWLSQLTPANLILVAGASALSLVAGASILVEQQIISKTFAGILALICSVFTIIHNRLGCDQHQAECRRLQLLYQGLAVEYANLGAETDSHELKKKLQALNNELAQVKKGSCAQPSSQSIAKAKRLIGKGMGHRL